MSVVVNVKILVVASYSNLNNYRSREARCEISDSNSTWWIQTDLMTDQSTSQAAQAHKTRSYIILLLCERSAKRDMGHINVTLALQHMQVLCLYGNPTVLLEKSILLTFCQ